MIISYASRFLPVSRDRSGIRETPETDSQPISAATARDRGVIAEVVPDRTAMTRARELATLYLAKPALARRNSRLHFN